MKIIEKEIVSYSIEINKKELKQLHKELFDINLRDYSLLMKIYKLTIEVL